MILYLITSSYYFPFSAEPEMMEKVNTADIHKTSYPASHLIFSQQGQMCCLISSRDESSICNVNLYLPWYLNILHAVEHHNWHILTLRQCISHRWSEGKGKTQPVQKGADRQTLTPSHTAFWKGKWSIQICVHKKLHATFRDFFNFDFFTYYTSRNRCTILPTFYIIKVLSRVGSESIKR